MPYLVLDPAEAEVAPVVTLGAPLTSVGMTLLQYQLELAAQLGGREDVEPERLNLWINWAYRDIATSLRHSELETSFGIMTVADQPLYALPSGIFVIEEVATADAETYSIAEGAKFENIDRRKYRSLPVLTGEPYAYFRHGNLLVFYGTPEYAREVVVDVRIMPEDLVAETDSPILSQAWHEAILLNARKKAFAALLEFDKSALAENDFVDSIRRRIDPEAEEQSNKIIRSSVPRYGSQLNRSLSRGLSDGLYRDVE